MKVGGEFEHAGIRWLVTSLSTEHAGIRLLVTSLSTEPDAEGDEFTQRATAVAVDYLPIPYQLID